jgi:hypothetical protein
MKFSKPGSAPGVVLTVFFASAVCASGVAQGAKSTAKPVITVQKQTVAEMRMEGLPESENALVARMPENAHYFGAAAAGETADLQTITLNFDDVTKLTELRSTPDFKIEPGGSCSEGNVYQRGGSCTVLMRFTPQGPGHRLGRLTISHSASAEPMTVGLNGYGYAPVASFMPAVISTVAASYPSNAGLFSGAKYLAVDDGDGVWVADTGNNKISYLDSSGTFQSPFFPTAPIGVAVDAFGAVYATADSPDMIYVWNYTESAQYSDLEPKPCATGTTCPLGDNFTSPGALAFDHNESIFLEASGSVMRVTPATPLVFGTFPNLNVTPLGDSFPFTLGNDGPVLVDSDDTIYTTFYFSDYSNCVILAQAYYDALDSTGVYRKVAGGQSNCGYSGDGGQARDAAISGSIGQMAMDIAGNLYFTDTGNQRVRRIDGATGIITTVAGNGTAGYTGDGGPATQARLNNPSALGVDSQGQVYILNKVATTGAPQLLRKLGPNGILSYGSLVKGNTSNAQWVTLSNSGNAAMTFTRVFVGGSAAADFSIDPNTTTCILTQGSTLAAGESCQVGILFQPTAAGTRTANLTFLDNTATRVNTVQLSGTGTLPAPAFSITSPASSTTVAAGTTVKFSVSVTSASGPAPTGTVTFKKNGAAIGSPVTLASGAASVNLTGLTAGTIALSASYSGDSNYAAAGPLTRNLTVTAPAKTAATVKLAAKANPATSCAAIAFTATVSGKSGVVPTGKVELREGSKILAQATLKAGSVTLTPGILAAGSYTLTASYLGDADYDAAASSVWKETVEKGTTCATPPPNPVRGIKRPGIE